MTLAFLTDKEMHFTLPCHLKELNILKHKDRKKMLKKRNPILITPKGGISIIAIADSDILCQQIKFPLMLAPWKKDSSPNE